MPSHASSKISKVLVANRGEIAVRVIRAAKDAGLASVAVYAEPDADAPHVRLADEAFALGGQTSAESYLDFAKLLDAAEKSGANAIHPGYGFLSENADFAQAVIDAGLIWIGPSPQSIRDLGDKVTARHIAARAKAPLVPGTSDPVKDADEVVAFAKEYGVPIAIKAAFGGGGRGMKVARTIEEIPELFDSATREAVAAFGRGECFVERYLDKPRHVEAQVIADQHGNVVVAGTRDCSLQRRFQKLVEEAPAPFLDRRAAQGDPRVRQAHLQGGRLLRRRHRRVPGRPGRPDLVPRGQHPPAGRAPGHRGDRGHRPGAAAVQDRQRRDARHHRGPRRRAATRSSSASTARTPAAASCPRPARSPSSSRPPAPASGWTPACETGSVIGGQFDSMLAKLIVHRRHPRRGAGPVPPRAGRVPASRAWPPSSRSTAPWCPTRRSSATATASRCTPAGSRPSGTTPSSRSPAVSPIDEEDTMPRQTVVVEVGGRRLEVSLPGDLALGNGGGAPARCHPQEAQAAQARRPRRRRRLR